MNCQILDVQMSYGTSLQHLPLKCVHDLLKGYVKKEDRQ